MLRRTYHEESQENHRNWEQNHACRGTEHQLGTAGPILALVGALAVAVVGAFITGSEFGPVTQGVESVSAQSGNFLGDLGDLFPFGFAFSAGMVSSVNPCGFAMLPAYLGLYLSESEGGEAAAGGVASRLRRALLVGATVSVGFVVLFAAVGTPIGLGARGIADAFPWIGLIIGVLLVVTGAYLLSGGKLYNNFAASISSRFGDANTKSVRSYFTFGLAYGTASLSCTLPIFLAVIGGHSPRRPSWTPCCSSSCTGWVWAS